METHSSEYNGLPAAQTNNRRQHLDLEMPGWFDQLTTPPETPALAVVPETTPLSQLQDISPREARISTGFLNKLGKLFGRHEVD